MVKHAEITQKTGTAIYFADPHSPRQCSSNEITKGVLWQYLPESTNLSVYRQEELDEIADSLNTRLRKRLDWRTSLEIYVEMSKKSVAGPSTLQQNSSPLLHQLSYRGMAMNIPEGGY